MAKFFISHQSKDTNAALWIASELESMGHETIIDKRDFKPGNNFMLRMLQAAEDSDYTLCVMTESFLNSRYAMLELLATLAEDPLGEDSKLLIVMMGNCEIPALLRTTIYIDLRNLPEAKAKAELWEKIGMVEDVALRPRDAIDISQSLEGLPTEALIDFAASLAKSGATQIAGDLLTTLIDERIDNEEEVNLYGCRAAFYDAQDDTSSAESDYEAAIQWAIGTGHAWEVADALLARASFFERHGRKDGALNDYVQASKDGLYSEELEGLWENIVRLTIEIRPMSEIASMYLEWIRFKGEGHHSGNVWEWEKHLEKVEEFYKQWKPKDGLLELYASLLGLLTNKDLRISILERRAKLFEKQGLLEEARQDLDAIVASDFMVGSAVLHRAEFLERIGELEAARTDYQNLVKSRVWKKKGKEGITRIDKKLGPMVFLKRRITGK